MYLWLAVNIDDQLCPLKCRVQEVTSRLSAQNLALTLPFHVSLRISAPVEDAKWEEAADAIAAYFASLSPFDMKPEAIERNGGIVWLRILENKALRAIHQKLVDFPQRAFGMPPQPLDSCFLFHTTLFMGDETQAESAFALLKGEPFPGKLTARKFIMGISPTGRPGDYREVRTITVF